MEVSEIIREVQEDLPNSGFGVNRILSLINRGAVAIAAGRFNEYPEVGEICLPGLEVYDTITTTAGVASVALTGLSTYTFQKKLLGCYSNSQSAYVPVLDSPAMLEARYPGLTDYTGSIACVAEAGGNLFYAPASAETLKLHFFRKPTTLTDSDTPSFLPEHLQSPLLKYFVLSRIPASLRVGLGYDPETYFRQALNELYGFIGPYAHNPVHVNDEISDYYENLQ